MENPGLCLLKICLPLGLLGLWACIDIDSMPVVVLAKIKTEPVPSEGDAADDAAIYINRENPEKSLIIATDKKSGLLLYDLQGKELQRLSDGKQNNVDIRQDVVWDGHKIALVVTGNRTTDTIDFYSLNEEENLLKPLSVRVIPTNLNIYGLCLYQNAPDRVYLFGTQKDGQLVQWLLNPNSPISLTPVREIKLSSQVEGCVADDETGQLYVAEENKGIWKFKAEPTEGDYGKLIDSTSGKGHLSPDIEGLALYKMPGGKGYLLASSQGDNTINAYDRQNGQFVSKFAVEFEGKRIIETDGIEATSEALGNQFPNGLLIVQDGHRVDERQTFKLVSWTDVAQALASH